jgi:hypothetical protein
MIKLNLLPEKVRAAERLQLIILLGVLVYGLGLTMLGWRWVVAHHRVAGMDQQIAVVQDQLNAPELRDAVVAVDRFTKDEKEKSDKASVVNSLRKKQVTLLRLLDSLPDWTMDGQVWMQTLDVKYVGAERKVAMDGYAVSPLAFAHFFTNLENQPIVKKIALDAAPTKERLFNKPVMRFKLSFSLEDYQ